MGKLTARQVATSKPARIGDGDGLWLETSPTSKRRWLIRYSRPGGAGVTETAIGSATYMSLAEAREAAFEFKRNLATGIPARSQADVCRCRRRCPGSEVCALEGQDRKPDRPSLGQVAHLLQAPQRRRRWRYRGGRGLERPQAPYRTKPAAADGVRSVMEAVFSAAKVRGLRSGDNPAVWRNNLDHVLPRRPQLVNGHHFAMPDGEVALVHADSRTAGWNGFMRLPFRRFERAEEE